MKSQITAGVDIASYTTFRLGGPAKFFAIATTPTDIPDLLAFAKTNEVGTFILGSGSNIVANDEPLEMLVIKMEIDGIEKIAETKTTTTIKAGAGVVWDNLVAWAVKHNLAGIEALSAVPGTCGAAPVQNIGAYGAEFKDVCESVEVYDTQTNSFTNLTNKQCQFAYRDSIFKHQKNRYVITSITLKLTPMLKSQPAKIPDYPGVKEYLDQKKITKPTLSDIRKAITDIRWSKLPKPSELANVGSFFKNATVDQETLDELLNKYPNLKYFPINNKEFKVPAGWLIEQAGLKGFTRDSLSTYAKNALVITNHGQATFDDLKSFVSEITRTVNNKFGITLEVEPIFVE